MKILEADWSYQLKSTANSDHLPENWAKLAKLAVLFRWKLQNVFKDFFFSIPMNADYLFYVKSIATSTPTFLGYIISVLAGVKNQFSKTDSRCQGLTVLIFIIHTYTAQMEKLDIYFSCVCYGFLSSIVMLRYLSCNLHGFILRFVDV